MTRAEMLMSDSNHLDRLPGDGDIQAQRSPGTMKVCIVGASGKLGQYIIVDPRICTVSTPEFGRIAT